MAKFDKLKEGFKLFDYFHHNPPGLLPTDTLKHAQLTGEYLHKIYLKGYEDGLNEKIENVDKLVKNDTDSETKTDTDKT
ncbi:hypothetical protein [Flavobacterium aestivum]|uniref:hypothetical protein n=1 Tax=Flavobacterium aestivum TaxID=3003257 RepID=UPI0024828157|nr:hypothetical protein [Flavobacterium aestivum]